MALKIKCESCGNQIQSLSELHIERGIRLCNDCHRAMREEIKQKRKESISKYVYSIKMAISTIYITFSCILIIVLGLIDIANKGDWIHSFPRDPILDMIIIMIGFVMSIPVLRELWKKWMVNLMDKEK